MDMLIQVLGTGCMRCRTLHEMVKKGVLFRPEGRGSIYKLTAKGVNWVEREVLPPIREKQAALA